MKRKLYKKGGAINDVVETSTDNINVEPMNNEPANNEPKKYVDPTGKEWCECPPPKTTFNRIESIKNFGKNADQGVKNFQEAAINRITGKSSELGKKLSDTFKNAANKALGNEDKIIVPNANPEPNVAPIEEQKGGQRHTHKHCNSKHCHSKHRKHCHSKHKHSKHKHSKRKQSKRKQSKHKQSKQKTQKRKH